MADQLEGARTTPVKFADQGDGSVAERIAALGYLFDDASSLWVPERCNLEGTLFTSAAVTGVQSRTLTNYNARGLLLYLSVSSAGAGTLTVHVGSAVNGYTLATFAGLTAAATLCVCPGAGITFSGTNSDANTTGLSRVVALPIPRSVLVDVTPTNLGASWTYGIGYALIK